MKFWSLNESNKRKKFRPLKFFDDLAVRKQPDVSAFTPRYVSETHEN